MVSPFVFLVWGKISSHGRTECGELSFGRHCSSARCAMTVRIRSDDIRWVLVLSRSAEHSIIRGVYLWYRGARKQAKRHTGPSGGPEGVQMRDSFV